MTQDSKAKTFAALHRPGTPIVLFNAWDAGSAATIAGAGARAIATGSWSVAAANGFADGEALPLAVAIANLERIVAAVDLPVTIDLEGGYGEPPATAAATAGLAMAAGAIGCNFEDQRVGQDGLYPVDVQAERIRAIRHAAGERALSFFINARTDLFLKAAPQEHEGLVGAALERAHAYAEAGADGFFVPGLVDETLIATVCSKCPLPVNVMMTPSAPPAPRLAELGVARISHGPGPYRLAMQALAAAATAAHSPN